MPHRLKILSLGSEAVPFAKTGGLGDVCGALPKALRALGHEVRVVLPAYRAIEQALHSGRHDLRALPGHLQVPVRGGGIAGVLEGVLPGSDVPVNFIAKRDLFDRPEIYGYADDPYRFAFFSRAALDLIPALEWRPDIVHAHDWHAAPAVAWLATSGSGDERFRGIPTLFTIHNLAYQGLSSWDLVDYLGMGLDRIHEEKAGELNFMARGIYHATLVNTVSPTYSREIMTAASGAGLDGLLRFRSFDVHGILNGLDNDVWNPAADPHLAEPFDARRIGHRAANKRTLQERAGLPQRDDVPLLAVVSRLDRQKGMDLLGPVLDRLLQGQAGETQFVVLGTGAEENMAMFARLASRHPGRMRAFLAYSAELAPLIYGGSDLLLMPSRFEPCGLGQLIAMRYGCVPVVRATGGLADTVQDAITGFTFADFDTGSLWDAVQRAIQIYKSDHLNWRRIQRNGMKQDFSLQRAAHGYQQLFEWAIARMKGG